MLRKKSKPARLEKKTEVKFINEIKNIITKPEFWLLIIVIIFCIFLIYFAIQESTTYFVYNRGL